MAKIVVLDEHIANQIAAGEVVERPASVVKELVENAIDAGAASIEVQAEEGGLSLIRVIDNGSGIDPDDCEAAFYRHATSKLLQGRDLFQIRSLGFRGEALPSIAAVAKVRLVTANSDQGLGRAIEIEGGNLKLNEEIATPQGTDITVKELFYNTPARLKYMKTIQTELGHISDVMYRQALSHPEIAFTFRHNGNTLLQSQGGGDLLQVIAAIYGVNTSKGMVAIEAENLDYRITGYIGRPELTRSNRSGMSTIVNGRYIRNQGLHQAVLRAYHTLLPINRYPLGVLMLDMHPSLVDVNVHPAKLEVRFSKEPELNGFVEESIRSLLSEQVLIPQVVKQNIGRGSTQAVIQEQFHFTRPEVTKDAEEGREGTSGAAGGSTTRDVPSGVDNSAAREQAAASREAAPAFGGSAGSGAGAGYSAPAGGSAAAYALREQAAGGYASGSGGGASAAAASPGSYAPGGRGQAAPAASGAAPQALYGAPQEAPELPAFPELELIGQHHGTYLIAQNQEGLYLIDQHAAHERVNYEYYYEKFGHPADASQELLLPITLEFTPSDSEKLKERLSWFERVGVILEHFGGGTFRVVSHPYWFPSGEEVSIIEEMAEWVLSERAIDLSKLREKSSTLVSCKASIKANQKITAEEADTLLQRLAACKQPYTCPHGRPIIISFSNYDLEKLFKRVM
ncbi:DNA mismatch repair endonuclease MutL [Paenibacillus motobuensis]|uniref:DNA mismatch repair endonuclease MutL n=1 Tax=Paenibacillus TaxID=44249 RepID=UPI00203F855E|nr:MULTISPECIES: DNA mismatch repair endonuclease MutL [Paenibacillus]MCM3039189.1 DNA mismatch repair endonuclease MutL [Paenibacillus lutimineralis]MCM3646293.1 DNA mismatch repair endonuclease MutL [Paenibacillus motobuensis]